MSAPDPTPHALADPRLLVGTWVLDRTIVDRAGALGGQVEGHLHLTEVEPGRLAWEEEVTWHRPTGDVAGRRGLVLLRRESGWWVLFEDGRDFHPWRPGEPVVHPCSPDTYRGLVTGSPAQWSVSWEVAGPAKDYTMTTVLTQQA